MLLPPISSVGWGHPALRGNKIISRSRGGACPARDLTAITTLWVTCRGGIYAARCNCPDITNYRVNRTERSRPFPTTCRKQAFSPITAYVPVICREGSRPLLTDLRQPPISSAGWGHPALHRNFTAIFLPASLSYKCARAARTPHLLSIIYYLLFKLPRRGNLVPDGAPIRNVPGNRNKKTALRFP